MHVRPIFSTFFQCSLTLPILIVQLAEELFMENLKKIRNNAQHHVSEGRPVEKYHFGHILVFIEQTL
jgi:hypothetical protein